MTRRQDGYDSLETPLGKWRQTRGDNDRAEPRGAPSGRRSTRRLPSLFDRHPGNRDADLFDGEDES